MKSTAFHKKDFYFISDIASILHVSTHTIRNLETEFGIEVKKDLNGKRVYTLEDVEKYRVILDRKNETKDVATLKNTSNLKLNLEKAPISMPNTEAVVYSSSSHVPINSSYLSESIFSSLKSALSTKAISYYSLALFTIVTAFSYGSFYLDKYLDLDTGFKSIDSSKYMSNVLQSTDTTWDYRFDVNVPAYFNSSLNGSAASFDLIRVGDRVLITPQGISAPNLVNNISTLAGETLVVVDNTNPNTPVISTSKNPVFTKLSIGALAGVKTLDAQTVTTIENSINLGTGDAQTLNGLADADFLRSNADTVFTNGIMTFDASSSLKFNNIASNSFLRVGANNNLTAYTIEPGLNVTFDSNASSLTINVATGASSNVFASVAISSLFIGGSSFDISSYVQASATEINKLSGLSGNILTTNNFLTNFSNIDTNASDDLLSANLTSSILTAFPDLDTTGSNKVLISSLASLMLTNYTNLDTNATDDLLTSNLASSLFSIFPNIDTNASDDAGILADAVLISSTAGKNVYSTNTWFGTQTFNSTIMSELQIQTNGRIVLNPGAVPGNINNSIYNNNDRIYFEDLPLIQMSDTHVSENAGKLSYFVTDASGRLLLTGTDNVALSQIVTGASSQILGMDGSSLKYLTVNGDLTVSTTSSSTISFTLNNVNSTTGSFGEASYIPQITVNSKGLITSISTVAVSSTATNPNNYVYDINFSSPSSSNKTLLLSRFGLSTLSASFTITSGDVVNALGYTPQTNLGYTPLNSTAFNSANITNALGYVPFGFANFVAGSNVTLSSTATSVTINSSYVDTDTNNYTSSIAFTDSNAVSKVLTLNRNGLSALTAVFSISAANVTSALGYTPLNSTAFNAANITNALGFIPLQVSSLIAGTNITLDTTAGTITINGVSGGTNANNYVSGISFSSPEAASRTLVLSRFGLSNLTATFSLSASDITSALGYTPLQASSTGADKYINTFGIATNLIDENVQLNFSLGRSDTTTILASTTLTPAIITTALGYIPQANLGYVPFNSSAFTSTNIISALGYTPLNSTAFNSANITNALGYVPFGFANFVAGSNVTLSSTATSVTINSSYVDTDTNNYTSSIAFTDSNAVSKVLTLNRNGLSALTAVFSISAANVTSALGYVPQVDLGYTPLRNTSDTLSGNLAITGTLSANAIFQNGYGVCDASGNCAGLGGTILGNGNAGFLSYFTASNSIANSSVYESSSKIGILTTNPQEALDVYGAIKLSANMGTLARSNALYNEGGTLYWNGQVVGVTGSTGPGGINGTEGYLPFFNTSNSLIATEFYYNSGNTERSLELITSLTIPTYLAIGHKGQYSAKLGVAADSSSFFTRYDSEDDVVLQNTSTLATSDMIFALNNASGKYIFGFGTGTQAGAVVINYQNSSNSAYLGINNTNPSFALDVSDSARITGTLATSTFSNPIGSSFNFLTGSNFRGNLSAANASLNNLSLANALPVIFGGTGLSALPTNGQILIGNGTGYTLATLTAGSNVSISTTAGGITISSSYVDTTNANNYVNAISFSTPATGSRTLVLSREGLSNLTASFSLSSSDITSALGYTPLKASDTAADSFVNTFGIATNLINQNVQFNFSLGRNDSTTILASTYLTPQVVTTALGYTPLKNTTDSLTGSLGVSGDFSASNGSFNSLAVSTLFNPDGNEIYVGDSLNMGDNTVLNAGYVYINGDAFVGLGLSANSLTLTNALEVIYGGTGLSALPTNGQILIGNGTGYTLATLTAGSNVSISTTAGGITISSSYVDTTNANNYVNAISFSTPATGSRTLVLSREGLSNLTASFSLSSSDITSALGYTPFNSSSFTSTNIISALGYTPLSATDTFADNAVDTVYSNYYTTYDVATESTKGFIDYAFYKGATFKFGNSLKIDPIVQSMYSYYDSGTKNFNYDYSNGETVIFQGTTYFGTSEVIGALGYTPFDASNFTAAYITNALNYVPFNSADFTTSNINSTIGYVPFNSSSFTSVNIVNVLGYTPLKNTTDTLTGDLTVTGSLSTEHLYIGDYQNTSRLQLEALVTTDRKLRFDIGAANLSNATFGLNLQSVYFTTPSNANVKNLTFNHIAATNNITVDIFKAGTLPSIYNNTLDVYGATIAASLFSNPNAGPFFFLSGANFGGDLSAANGSFNNLGVVTRFSAGSASITGNFSAGTAFVNGYFSAGSSSLGATTINGNLSAALASFTGLGVSGNFSAANGNFATGLFANNFSGTSGFLTNLGATNFSAASGFATNFGVTSNFSAANGNFATGLFANNFSGTSGFLTNLGATNFSAASGFATNFGVTSNFSAANGNFATGLFANNFSGTSGFLTNLGATNFSAASGFATNFGVTTRFSAGSASITGNFSAGTAFVNGYFSAGSSSLGATTINGNVSAALGFFTTTATSTFSNPLGGVFTFLTGANFNGNISAANATFVTLSAQSLNVNNLFTVDSTGSVFNNGVTFNDTVEFNAVGDLAVANDIVFTNNSFSKIRTATDLSIEVGEPFNSSNLNFNVYNNGSINFSGTSVFSSTIAATSFSSPISSRLFSFLTGTIATSNLFVNGYFSAGASTLSSAFISGTLYANETFLTPIGGDEGGQIWFSGATASYENWFVDVWQDKFRIIKSGDTGNGVTNQVQIFNTDGTGEAGLGVEGIGIFGGLSASGNYKLEVVGGFSAGSSSLGATRINGNLTGTGNIQLAANSTIIVQNLSSPATSAPRIQVGASTFYPITTGAGSDLRLKDGIEEYDGGLAIIDQLSPVSFNFRDLNDLNVTLPDRTFGFIAQEVQNILPQIVIEGVIESNGVSYKGVDYGRLTPVLVSAIKEQQVQILALSSAQASVNFSQAASMYDAFMNTIDNLSMSTENGSLVVNTNLTVTGRSLFNDASFTGDVTIGQMKFDSLNNDLSFNGTSCVNIDGTLNTNLCDSQTMYLMKNKAGNLNIFDGKVVINPLGEMTIEKIQAGEVAAAKIKASEYEIIAGSEVSGNTNMLAGQTEITILTSKVKSNSKIFVTANNNLDGKSLYVSDKVEGASFKVKLNQALSSDVNFDWFILNIE